MWVQTCKTVARLQNTDEALGPGTGALVSNVFCDAWTRCCPPGGGFELLQRYDSGAAPEDLRSLLRVPQDSQRRGSGSGAAGKVAGALLRRDQPARHGQVRDAAGHLLHQTGVCVRVCESVCVRE